MTIGIIGFGRFGKLISTIISQKSSCKIKIYDPGVTIDGIRFFSLEEAAVCDIIIPSVPISQFKICIKAITPLLKRKTLVIDVCSVMMWPAVIMKKFIPHECDILLTHPLFGPDSTHNGQDLKGFTICITKVRIINQKKYKKVLTFFDSLGLIIKDIEPEEHDKLIARTQGFAFFVGKIGQLMNITDNITHTKGFSFLLENQYMVENDTDELFYDLQNYNQYCKEMREEFIICEKLLNKNIQSRSKLIKI